MDVVASRLGYSEYGEPSTVVSLQQEQLSCQLGPSQVLARYLLSPVNPADVNVLQGSYPIRPPLPATAGGEGVAEVISVGEQVRGEYNVFEEIKQPKFVTGFPLISLNLLPDFP